MIGHAPQHISGFRDKIYFWRNEKWKKKKKRTKKKKNPATSSSRKEVNLEVILKIFVLFLKFQIRSVSSVTMLQPFLNGAILN